MLRLRRGRQSGRRRHRGTRHFIRGSRRSRRTCRFRRRAVSKRLLRPGRLGTGNDRVDRGHVVLGFFGCFFRLGSDRFRLSRCYRFRRNGSLTLKRCCQFGNRVAFDVRFRLSRSGRRRRGGLRGSRWHRLRGFFRSWRRRSCRCWCRCCRLFCHRLGRSGSGRRGWRGSGCSGLRRSRHRLFVELFQTPQYVLGGFLLDLTDAILEFEAMLSDFARGQWRRDRAQLRDQRLPGLFIDFTACSAVILCQGVNRLDQKLSVIRH